MGGVIYIYYIIYVYSWEVLESDGRRVRSLSDGQQIVTLEYNNNSQLIQCWETKQGRTDDAISLLFYSVSKYLYHIYVHQGCKSRGVGAFRLPIEQTSVSKLVGKFNDFFG